MTLVVLFLMAKISLNLRRNNIFQRLQAGHVLDSHAIAREFDVSWRTIHRDFLDYFPQIVQGLTQDSNTHRWYIDRQKQNSLLSEKEELTLHALLDLSKKHSSEFYLEVKSLIDKFRVKNDESVFYSRVDTESLDDVKDDMIKVEKAIVNKKIITCFYNKKERVVAPLKIASFDGYWYLIVKDLKKEKQSINSYYFKEIENLVVTDKTHQISCPDLYKKLDCAINAFFKAEADCYPLTLHATNKIAKFFKRKPISKTQRIIQEFEDGSMDFEVMITNEMEIMPIVKKYHPDLKVV
jgi:predicted DNA-binding transcriptional regulator YafY